ncbi:Oidioi.mRNA.OKI2018_I69.chr2.g4556.t1.cds [Oikopleura dioica]|uniref:Oidioi.mRNA.OKI2018_I69.chr2.g4556.t1.cds n=1 Tax=Oikopleura dioica TaxID=34765 RepID=A0ABN7SZA4_OIKDI|nr:Oidioi.mRNA.OKI2018_I69.chr2.g4556.t1.cds [Oikopleura dioica]
MQYKKSDEPDPALDKNVAKLRLIEGSTEAAPQLMLQLLYGVYCFNNQFQSHPNEFCAANMNVKDKNSFMANCYKKLSSGSEVVNFLIKSITGLDGFFREKRVAISRHVENPPFNFSQYYVFLSKDGSILYFAFLCLLFWKGYKFQTGLRSVDNFIFPPFYSFHPWAYHIHSWLFFQKRRRKDVWVDEDVLL